MLVTETILSAVAESLQLPPEVVRQRNFYQNGDVTYYGQTMTDCLVRRRKCNTFGRWSPFNNLMAAPIG
jgi:xanthine dehydrogenase molybdopterin-binding subunit B